MKRHTVVFRRTGNAMVPEPRYQRVFEKLYADGETYPLQVVEERNMQSHNAYFATVHDAWVNLNEESAKHFPSAESLRKWALVQAGYYTERTFVCDTTAKAKSLAVFIRDFDTYGIIKVSGNIVQVFDAKSQSVSDMGADEFKASKDAVLEIISVMANTTSTELRKHAGTAA